MARITNHIQRGSKRCLENIVFMKEQLPRDLKHGFMKHAFFNTYNSIRVDLLRKAERETMSEEMLRLKKRFLELDGNDVFEKSA